MARTPRIRILIGVLLVLLVIGLVLLPKLRQTLGEAQRIERETAGMESAARARATQEFNLEQARRRAAENPRDVEALLQYASILGQNRRYEDALRQLYQAEGVDPNRVEIHLALAEVYQTTRILDLALSELRRAVEIDPQSVEALSRLGYFYIAMDWNLAAARLLNQSLSQFPNDPRLLTVHAQTLYQMGDFRGALAEIEAAKRLDPSNHALDAPLIDVYLQLGRPADSIKAASASIAHDPTNAVYFAGRARAKRMGGDSDGAEADARAALKLSPRNLAARYELALALQKRKADKDGETVLEGIVRENALYQQAALVLSMMYSREGRSPEAARLRNEFDRKQAAKRVSIKWSLRVGNHPEEAEAHYQLGRAYLSQQNYARAVVELKEALRLKPGDQHPRQYAAEALRGMNRPQEAAEIERRRD